MYNQYILNLLNRRSVKMKKNNVIVLVSVIVGVCAAIATTLLILNHHKKKKLRLEQTGYLFENEFDDNPETPDEAEDTAF